MDTLTIILYTITVIATTLFLWRRTTTLHNAHKVNENKLTPPSPLALPVVGHLHLLKEPLHRTLESLSHRYGPVFNLRLGSLRFLVVSSPHAAEECFTKHDVTFAGRPRVALGEIIGYDHKVITSVGYGDLWRTLRRVMTLEALSSNRIQQNAWIRQEEVRYIARKYFIGSGSSKKVNLNEAFFGLTKNLMMRMVTGMKWPSNGLDNDLFAPNKYINVCDMFPVLRWMGAFRGTEKNLRSIWQRRDQFFASLLEEARKGKEGGVERKTTTSMSMVEEMLALQEEEPEYYTDEILKCILLGMFTAGIDTTARTMEWTMSLLLSHPATFHKARSEIDSHVPTTRLVSDSDLSNLPFLRCIINETLRLFPVVPLLLPHCSSSDTTVSGYHVPKGTILLVNAWALQRDPAVWENPLAFKPERFESGLEAGLGFRLIPFGMGRRACAGSSLAMRTLMLALATWVQCFEWESAEGGLVVDMEELAGITMGKTQNLRAVCTPRACMIDVLSQL